MCKPVELGIEAVLNLGAGSPACLLIPCNHFSCFSRILQIRSKVSKSLVEIYPTINRRFALLIISLSLLRPAALVIFGIFSPSCVGQELCLEV